MIELFTQCDAEYGRRVSEGLAKASKQQLEKGPIGAAHTGDAVKEAATVSKESKPY